MPDLEEAEREAVRELREGDAGRCRATLAIPGAFGVEVLVRCNRTAWHRRGKHKAVLGEGAAVRWGGPGTKSGEAFPQSPGTYRRQRAG